MLQTLKKNKYSNKLFYGVNLATMVFDEQILKKFNQKYQKVKNDINISFRDDCFFQK